MSFILTSLAAHNTAVTLNDIVGGLVLQAHPSSINLTDDAGLSASEISESGDLAQLISDGRAVLSNGVTVIDATNVANIETELNPVPNVQRVTTANAYADTDQDGTMVFGSNLTVTRVGVGVWDYTFVTPMPDANYVVVGSTKETEGSGVFNDFNIWSKNLTANGFTVNVGRGDNTTGQDDLVDVGHSVIVYGLSTVVTSISDTDDIPEGTNNQYYSNARVDARLPKQVSVAGATSFNQNVSEGTRYIYISPASSGGTTFTPGAGESYFLLNQRTLMYQSVNPLIASPGTFLEVVRFGVQYFVRILQIRPNRFVANAENENLVTTNSTATPVDYVTLNVDIPETKRYQVTYHLTLRHSSSTNNYLFRCINTTTGDSVGYNGGSQFYSMEPKDGGADVRIPHTVISEVDLNAGTNTFVLQFRPDAGGATSGYYGFISVKEL